MRHRILIDVETDNPDLIARASAAFLPGWMRTAANPDQTHHHVRYAVHEADEAGIPTRLVTETVLPAIDATGAAK